MTLGYGQLALNALMENRWQDADGLAREALAVPEERGMGLYILGMLAWQCGEMDAAIQLLTAGFQDNAPMDECGHALAGVLIEEQRLLEAENLLALLLSQSPNSLVLRLAYGELLLKIGKSGEAEAQVDYLLAEAPTWSSSLRLKGDWIMETSRDLEAAIGCYQMARSLDARDMGAVIGLVVAYQMKGDMPEAAKLLLEIEATGVRSARLYRELGDLLLRLNNPPLALSACSKALEMDFNNPAAQYLAGEIYMRMNRPLLAEPHFRFACNTRPEWVAAQCSQARVEAALGHVEKALGDLEMLIERHPNENYPKLVKCYLLNALGRFDEALAVSEHIIMASRDGANLAFNRSMLLLRAGRLVEGWDGYRYRFQTGMVRRLPLSTPEWEGDYRPEARLLIVWEQGLGDTLQFCRFARLARQRVGRVILACQRGLEGLLKGLDGVDEVVVVGPGASAGAFPEHDCHTYMMTLPHWLGIDLAALPSAVNYLRADPERVEAWRQRIPASRGLRVGLVWAGNPLHTNDARRSLNIEQLLPLASVDRVDYYSILRGIDVGQLDALKGVWQVPDLGNSFKDFDDTAAVIELLDVVITVDTSVAHLCGALNKPVWLLLPYVPDWRWMSERDDSPWYPSARLFRQAAPDAWGDVVLRVKLALEALLSNKAVV